ncbi:MAG: DUF3298 and DUF4163 domain-containing protein [Clostridiales bacterium]|nr:DUF3298 and DUF4163 domain-containing protein [Clostridiales bacterium]
MKKKVAGRNKMNRFSKIGISAVAAFATIVLCLNALPSLARAADSVPVLSTIVDALTFGRFSGQDGRSGYDITVPQITGLSDTELEDALNELLLSNANAVLDAYDAALAEIKQNYPKLGVRYLHGYNVLANNDRFFTLKVWTTVIMAGANQINSYYTIDKRTDKLLTLPELFKQDVDYVTPVSACIKQQMEKKNAEYSNVYHTDEFTAIRSDQNFFINADGLLVIEFDEYEVAAGYAGTPQFTIPYDVIADIANKDILGA